MNCGLERMPGQQEIYDDWYQVALKEMKDFVGLV